MLYCVGVGPSLIFWAHVDPKHVAIRMWEYLERVVFLCVYLFFLLVILPLRVVLGLGVVILCIVGVRRMRHQRKGGPIQNPSTNIYAPSPYQYNVVGTLLVVAAEAEERAVVLGHEELGRGLVLHGVGVVLLGEHDGIRRLEAVLVFRRMSAPTKKR